MSKVGAAIKAARKAHGMTSKQLAAEIGLSEQFVGDVQRGYRVPSPETLLLFSNAFPGTDSAAWSWLWLRDTVGDLVADAMWRYAAKADVLDAVRPGGVRDGRR